MRHFAWSLSIGALAGLGAGLCFASTAYAQKGGGGGSVMSAGVAGSGTPLGNQQMMMPGLPVYGLSRSPGNISPTIGGVNSSGAVVGGTLNGGFYGSPGNMISSGIGGVNGSGAVVGGYLDGGRYGSPGNNISQGLGGVNGSGAVVGGYLDGGRYGSPGNMLSPGLGGVNGRGALVGGALDGGRYGSPGNFSATTGGVNNKGALISGTLNSGFQGFQQGMTGPNFFPSNAPTPGPGVPVAIVNLGVTAAPITVNPAPLFVETVEGGNFQYSWW